MTLSPLSIAATDIQPGDRTGRDGKTQYAQIHVRGGQVLARTQTRGTRSPSVAAFSVNDAVTVWRKR